MTLWTKARLKDSPSWLLAKSDSSMEAISSNASQNRRYGDIQLTDTPFAFSIVESYTFFNSSLQNLGFSFQTVPMLPIPCLGSVNHSVFVVRTGWIPLGDISASCKHMSAISVPIRRYDDIRNELTLMWFRPYCKSCELDGRTCGLQSDDGETACFVSSSHENAVQVFDEMQGLRVNHFVISYRFEIKQEDNSPLYNHTLATILVEYASAVYMSDLKNFFTWTCSRCDGLTTLIVEELIVDVENCLQAFVGVADDLNAIIIAFRGTQENQSVQNWIEDLFWKQLDSEYPGCIDGKVEMHHGFFNANNNTIVRSGILDGVSRAKKVYGDIKIMVTENVSVIAFASYYSEIVPSTFRITHEHDLVPHFSSQKVTFSDGATAWHLFSDDRRR
ncbi:hypothetical protein LXL04_010322 [Taraxacum kok-saghyz]